MDVYRALRGILFFYELFRLLVLVVLFAVFSPLADAVKGAFFPYLVYVAPNALFPLMALFIWLRQKDYRNYLPLYMAGKIITAAAFYGWGISALKSSGLENLTAVNLVTEDFVLFGGSFLLILCDIFSVFGSWFLARKTGSAEESSGLLAGGNGGL
jgi:hypothetical protein